MYFADDAVLVNGDQCERSRAKVCFLNITNSDMDKMFENTFMDKKFTAKEPAPGSLPRPDASSIDVLPTSQRPQEIWSP